MLQELIDLELEKKENENHEYTAALLGHMDGLEGPKTASELDLREGLQFLQSFEIQVREALRMLLLLRTATEDDREMIAMLQDSLVAHELVEETLQEVREIKLNEGK